MFPTMASLALRRQAPLYGLGVAAIVMIILPASLFIWPAHPVPIAAGDHLVAHQDPIRNGTLGFQKIFAINLPTRSDKRDNLILASALSNIHIEFVDGVTADEVNPASYPYNWHTEFTQTEYGVRRAHINAMERIVEEGLGSALIIEDDADWDVSLKTQLQSFAHAVRALQGADEAISPYGDAWDVLWMGHCGITCAEQAPYFMADSDPTVLPPSHFLPYWRDGPSIERAADSRIICPVSDGVCMPFYAVSAVGARRLLSALSVSPADVAGVVDSGAQIDVALGRICGSGFLRCFAPYPSLTGGYRAAGPENKGSDIHQADAVGKVEIKPAWSWGVMYSVMMNVHRLLYGDGTVHANWEDLPVLDVDPHSIPVVGGQQFRV
ncbi:hypothetical protein ASPZODRAFT_1947666 [Penicilliopsis zonata CBS 506.65]|uniref:Glycosyl transferase family 25 domain-containing protein n=1 Tax=Penicilliopsis zonata CBS 506.65 TaxID=1073090 RepID=A0A1L9SJI4_9EURO|nr:hypothetical protein ASPZODRAFT_1947666 [Penicilliopsis zonata CBS 506.65]OJJ47380.1 hypothetical protein ASPZODRAFT_1947666 [Penicilliopsis zonata CBS 506.65]